MKPIGAKGKKVRIGRVTYRSLAEAARVEGISYNTLYQRIRKGWRPTDAVRYPVRSYNQ